MKVIIIKRRIIAKPKSPLEPIFVGPAPSSIGNNTVTRKANNTSNKPTKTRRKPKASKTAKASKTEKAAKAEPGFFQRLFQ